MFTKHKYEYCGFEFQLSMTVIGSSDLSDRPEDAFEPKNKAEIVVAECNTAAVARANDLSCGDDIVGRAKPC